MTSSVEGLSIPNVGSEELVLHIDWSDDSDLDFDTQGDMSEDCSRKSLSSRSLQDTNVSSDPSIWFPALISETEELTKHYKALASKVGINRSESDGNLGHQEKNELAANYRKFLKAFEKARNNKDELVAKIEGAANIEVDQQDCSRKSLSRRSLQDTNVSSDPSILLTAIINKAENLATYSKALASKEFKEGKEADGSSCHQQKAEAQPNAAVGVEGVEDTEEWKGGVEDTRKNDETVECLDASFNSESEESVFQLDYSDSDSASELSFPD